MAKTAFPDATRKTMFMLKPETIVIVGYDTDDGLEHPLVNERVLKMKREGFHRHELVASFMVDGQLEPIKVRRNGDKIECVLGRNRVLAGREVNKQLKAAGKEPSFELESVEFKNNDAHALAGATEAENNVREGDDMLTKARNIQRDLNLGMTKQRCAISMGMTLEVLENHLRVLTLGAKMQRAVEKGVITATAATTFADLSLEEQDSKAEEIEKLGIIVSVPEARRQRVARSAAKKGKGKAPSMRGKGITVGVLRKLHDNEDFVGSLDVPTKAILSWIIGEEGSWDRKVPGLRKALRAIGELDGEE